MKRLLSGLSLSLMNSLSRLRGQDMSSFECSLSPGTIECNWKLRHSTKTQIDRDFGSALFLRIRDISGDRTSASLIIETTTNHNHAEIHLPAKNGKVLLELGYKTAGKEFITLEYKIYDLGIKRVKQPRYIDWFVPESESIHQTMYELSNRGFLSGGSEERIV